jgi:hypothetical protein
MKKLVSFFVLFILFRALAMSQCVTADVPEYNYYVPPASLDSVINNVKLLENLLASQYSDTIAFAQAKHQITTQIKEFSEHLYYRSLWDQAKCEPDKPNRILLLREIANIQYYNKKNKRFYLLFFKLHESSTIALIHEYSGDLESLMFLTNSSVCSSAAWRLKRAIKRAGGVWDVEIGIPPDTRIFGKPGE